MFPLYCLPSIILSQMNRFNEFNVILCRNVLICFNKSLQHRVLNLLYRSFNMFGVLGLSDKEIISDRATAGYYEEINASEKLYKKII